MDDREEALKRYLQEEADDLQVQKRQQVFEKIHHPEIKAEKKKHKKEWRKKNIGKIFRRILLAILLIIVLRYLIEAVVYLVQHL